MKGIEAALRKALDGQRGKDPRERERVYESVRKALAKGLEARSLAGTEKATSQARALDQLIESIENEYWAEPPSADLGFFQDQQVSSEPLRRPEPPPGPAFPEPPPAARQPRGPAAGMRPRSADRSPRQQNGTTGAPSARAEPVVRERRPEPEPHRSGPATPGAGRERSKTESKAEDRIPRTPAQTANGSDGPSPGSRERHDAGASQQQVARAATAVEPVSKQQTPSRPDIEHARIPVEGPTRVRMTGPKPMEKSIDDPAVDEAAELETAQERQRVGAGQRRRPRRTDPGSAEAWSEPVPEGGLEPPSGHAQTASSGAQERSQDTASDPKKMPAVAVLEGPAEHSEAVEPSQRIDPNEPDVSSQTETGPMVSAHDVAPDLESAAATDGPFPRESSHAPEAEAASGDKTAEDPADHDTNPEPEPVPNLSLEDIVLDDEPQPESITPDPAETLHATIVGNAPSEDASGARAGAASDRETEPEPTLSVEDILAKELLGETDATARSSRTEPRPSASVDAVLEDNASRATAGDEPESETAPEPNLSLEDVLSAELLGEAEAAPSSGSKTSQPATGRRAQGHGAPPASAGRETDPEPDLSLEDIIPEGLLEGIDASTSSSGAEAHRSPGSEDTRREDILLDLADETPEHRPQPSLSLEDIIPAELLETSAAAARPSGSDAHGTAAVSDRAFEGALRDLADHGRDPTGRAEPKPGAGAESDIDLLNDLVLEPDDLVPPPGGEDPSISGLDAAIAGRSRRGTESRRRSESGAGNRAPPTDESASRPRHRRRKARPTRTEPSMGDPTTAPGRREAMGMSPPWDGRGMRALKAVAGQKRPVYAMILVSALIIAFVGMGAVWLLGSGALQSSEQRDTSVPNPPPTISGEDYAGLPAPDGAFSGDWIDVFTPPDLSTVSVGPAAQADLIEPGGVMRVVSRDPETDGEVSFELGSGLLNSLSGNRSLVALTLRSADDTPTQIYVRCRLPGGGDCGRHRYDVTYEPSDMILSLDLPGGGAQPGYLAINSDISGSGHGIDVLGIRIRPE